MYEITYYDVDGFKRSHSCSAINLDSCIVNINRVRGMVISVTKVS